jgi:ribosomal protein S12 methylthiotransferase accessory factor
MILVDELDALASAVTESMPVLRSGESNTADILSAGRSMLKSGMIRKLQDFEIPCNDLQLFGSIALHGGRHLDGRYTLPRICGGSGFTREDARVRVYGEAAERHCASIYDESTLRFGSYVDLKNDAVTPEAFALYAPKQYETPGFEFRPFTKDTKINWAQGYSLTNHRPAFVPAAFTYLPYWPVAGETPIGLLPSTGLSCGSSMAEAILRGIFEIVERDAIMIMWLNRVAARRLDLTSIDSEKIKSMKKIGEDGVLEIFDITTDVNIPTRFALLTDSFRKRSIVSCGAATRWDAGVAAEKAAAESLVVRLAVQRIIRTNPVRNYGKDYQKVREVDDHLRLYTDPAMLPALTFLTGMTESSDPKSDSSIAEFEYEYQLKLCLDMLSARNLEVIAVDLTQPDVADMGLHVVRVIIPGMIPLSFGTNYVCSNGQRLTEVPQSLGYELPKDGIWPNPVPHPFA